MYKFAVLKDGELVKKLTKHPNKNGVLMNPDKGVIVLPVVYGTKPDYNPNQYTVTEKEPVISDDKVLIGYTLVERPQEEVIASLTSNLQMFIDTNLPQRMQIDLISKAHHISIKQSRGISTEEEDAYLDYLISVQEWQVKISNDRDQRVLDYKNNGTFPSFEWDDMPKQN